MKKKGIYTVLALSCCSALIYGQTPVQISNEGVLSITPDEILSFQGDFENRKQGAVTNDGTVFYFFNFLNDGYYGGTPHRAQSTTVFKTNEYGVVKQISGNAPAAFHDVVFDSPTPVVAFDLKNNIDIYGTADLQAGIIKIDETVNPTTAVSHGMMSFHSGSKAVNMDDEAHVEGEIEKLGNTGFSYPFGVEGFYRSARISAPRDTEDVFTGRYVYKDEAFFETRTNTVGIIEQVNNQEYWIIEKGTNTKSDVLLTLSWDSRTTAEAMLVKPEEQLHIVRWDETRNIWVDEGGVVDMSTREVTTIGTVKGYGVFTLATVKKDWALDGGIVIYNLVSPNGDGMNDYFIIDNIQNYPNKVEIYNRWGARVYETTNYDVNGDGSANVFTGHSEGKGTVNKGGKLPSGTYYYVITYEYSDANGSRTIRKAANLHLENN